MDRLSRHRNPARAARSLTFRAIVVPAFLIGALLWISCSGSQSALAPAGRGAEQISDLFWWMTGGAFIIWLLVVGLAVYATRVNTESHSERGARLFIIGGGAVFPTVVLTGLLGYGLHMLPELLAPPAEGSLRIAVSGEQWWWRVHYLTPGGEAIVLANEIRLPVDEPVEFVLVSPDVIHSLWIPSLGGKMDMIPGRETRLTLHPTRVGTYRGACAEYCGESHALMNFPVVVSGREEFHSWLRAQAAPAMAPDTPEEVEGARVFSANGCGSCHAIRGTAANGTVGPDLTHVGSRLTIGAGILENEPEQFAAWLERTDHIKPGVEMPAFGMLGRDDLRVLSIYLDGLK